MPKDATPNKPADAAPRAEPHELHAARAELAGLIAGLEHYHPAGGRAGRALALARTNLEQARMWVGVAAFAGGS
jgi:hypothetical protein